MKREHFKWILLLFTFLIVLAGCGSSSKAMILRKNPMQKLKRRTMLNLEQVKNNIPTLKN